MRIFFLTSRIVDYYNVFDTWENFSDLGGVSVKRSIFFNGFLSFCLLSLSIIVGGAEADAAEALAEVIVQSKNAQTTYLESGANETDVTYSEESETKEQGVKFWGTDLLNPGSYPGGNRKKQIASFTVNRSFGRERTGSSTVTIRNQDGRYSAIVNRNSIDKPVGFSADGERKQTAEVHSQYTFEIPLRLVSGTWEERTASFTADVSVYERAVQQRILDATKASVIAATTVELNNRVRGLNNRSVAANATASFITSTSDYDRFIVSGRELSFQMNGTRLITKVPDYAIVVTMRDVEFKGI